MSEQDLENLLKRHTKDLAKLVQLDGKKQYSCHVDGEEEYDAFTTDLNAIGFSFYTRSAKANESSRALFSYSKKDGDLQIPFFGSPFQILKSSYMFCSMDGNYKPTTRPVVSADEPSAKKFRFSNQPTKKVGCQAIMRVKCLRIFDEEQYKLGSPYKRHCRSKNKILSQLGADLLSDDPPSSLIRFMIVLSAADEHNHSVVTTNHSQRLHPRLKEEIYGLVRSRPDCTTKSVKAHLREVVRTMFETSGARPPDPENRCYYPIDHVIRFHMYQAHAALDRGGHDQDALANRVRAWIREYPEDDFYLRPRASEPGGGRKGAASAETSPRGSSLLFCHQTKWQRHLLRRYGDEICTLEAASVDSRLSFPLYFLAVRTNAGDLIAGTFVVQRDTADHLSEALARFREWNPEWDPEFFLSGRSDAESESIARTFPRSTAYVGASQRERDWERWLAKKGNVPRRSAAAIRSAWDVVARSFTEEDYVRALRDLDSLAAYRDCPAAVGYFATEWLPSHQAWVEAFRRADLSARVDTNITGWEPFLPAESVDRTLPGIAAMVVETVLPTQLERYALANVPLDHREYDQSVPEFLRDRPVPFIEAVMLRYEEATCLDPSLVSDLGEGLFAVRAGGDEDEWRSVDFLEANCPCDDFARNRVPCVHMCAVFVHTEWGFDRLPAWYRDHPYITVDHDFAGEVGVKIDFEGGDVEEGEAKAEMVEEEMEQEEEKVEQEEEEEEQGETDIELLMESTREKLLAILGYTYLEHDIDGALKIANSVMALDDAISGNRESDRCKLEGPTAIKTEPDDTGVGMTVAPRAAPTPGPTRPPRRVFPRLKIGKKNVGRCEVPVHRWREYVTEKVDVYPPQTADQIVVIDVNHRQQQ